MEVEDREEPLVFIFTVWDRNLAALNGSKSLDQQVKHVTSADNNSAREDRTLSVWKGNLCPPTWAIIFTDDCLLTRSASGNQVEGQNSKDLCDKVNSKRDASMPFQLFT